MPGKRSSLFRYIPEAAVLLAAWIAAGCGSTINIQVRQAAPSAPKRNTTLLAGVGKADITPRPGMPTAGYAINGNSGMGFRQEQEVFFSKAFR